MSDMQQKLIAVIVGVLNVDCGTLSADTTRESLSSWDSLAHLQIISEIEDTFSVMIPFEAVSKISSIRDFEAYLIR